MERNRIVSLNFNRRLDFNLKPFTLNYLRFKSYLDLAFTFINIIVWNILGVLIPYNERHIYKFPQDGWRIFLFVINILIKKY